ncbi:MAG: DUF5033 domain-containing protein, partial [Clostridia bacterium]|nr:DUF5033 domain-containing protein [Clostridia bacterium]
MKTRLLFLAVSVVMALTSCSAELIDPADSQVTKSVLETEYNALKVESVLPDIASLPVMSMSEAENLLVSLRTHKNAKEEFSANIHDEGEAHKWELNMKQTIDGKYAFSIQLSITSYDDGSLFYDGYSANCSLSKIFWQVGGFSFESDKAHSEDFKFNSSSSIFLNVVSQNGECA